MRLPLVTVATLELQNSQSTSELGMEHRKVSNELRLHRRSMPYGISSDEKRGPRANIIGTSQGMLLRSRFELGSMSATIILAFGAFQAHLQTTVSLGSVWFVLVLEIGCDYRMLSQST